jgi:RNA polymerase primary sigma factor
MTLADASDRSLEIGQIQKECAALGLDERQIQLVCAYLEMNQVKIQGFSASEEDKSLFRNPSEENTDENVPGDSAEEKTAEQSPKSATESKKKTETTSQEKTGNGTESAYYRMYLDELKQVKPCTEAEEAALLTAALAGEEAAKERLVEGNLHRVVEISKAYLGKGVLAADLIQEGNMALFMAVSTYQAEENFRLHVLREVENAMVEAIREQTGSDEILNTMAAEANALMKATEQLAERYGREATSEELAEYLRMSKDRVETLVKISLDAMNLSNE